MKKQLLMTGGCLLVAVGAPWTANAQTTTTAPQPTTRKPQFLEEIVVTARRKSENIEKVPTTVTAFSQTELQKREIHTQSDLQRAVPGLTVRESTTSNEINYSIRGQTVDPYSTSQPGVLSYIDDYQLTTLSADSFFDLQSIQVLKGPQGTLFGRNTTGGAVLFTTAPPSFTGYSGAVTTTFGSYFDKQVQGYVNLPVVSDKLAIRLSGDFQGEDGYVTNIAPIAGVGDRDLGLDYSRNGRISVALKPFDGLTNDTVAQFSYQSGTTLGGPLYSLNACGAPGLATTAACLYSPIFNPALYDPYLAAHPGTFPGGIAAFLALQKARGPYTVDYNSPSFFASRNVAVINTTTYHINDDMLVKNIFGYSGASSLDSTDVDGSPYTIYNYGPFGQSNGQVRSDNQYSDETQLQGKLVSGRLDYVLGAYVSHEEQQAIFSQNYFELAPLLVLPASKDANLQTFKSEAVFGQASYDLSSLTGITGLKLTGGVRYTWEHVTSLELPESTMVGPELGQAFSDPSWTVGLEYQVQPNLLLYATQRGSWRSGGFNGFKPPSPGLADVGGSLFLPETTKDVEIGMKFGGTIDGRPLRLNVSAYNQWVDNVQRVVYVELASGPTAVTANVPSAEISGLEVDGEYSPADWLKVGGNVAYTDARFTNGQVDLYGVQTKFGPYADSPRWAGTAFGEATLPVPLEYGDVSFRTEIYAQTKEFFSSTEASIDPGTQIPGYSLLSFRLDWNQIYNTKLGASFFVNNALNKTYYLGGLPVGSVFGLNTAIPGRPRFLGGELRYRF